MKERLAQTIWLIIIILFIGMEIYHLAMGNYNDLITSLLAIIVLIFMFAIYYLIKKHNKNNLK